MLDKFLPPTDNLYKFTAISGLLLIVFSFVPNYFSFKLGEQIIDLRKRTNIIHIEKDYLSDTPTHKLAENLNQRNEALKNTLSQIPKDEKSLRENYGEKYIESLNNEALQIKDKTLQVMQEVSQVEKQQMELKIKLEELSSATTLAEYYEKSISDLRLLSYGTLITGVGLVILGFRWWYVKVQKPNDLILVNEAKAQQSTKQSEPKKHQHSKK